MFGGGVKKGYLYGETADERPLIATKNPVSVMDLHATIMTAMGISPKTEFDHRRPPLLRHRGRQGQTGDGIFG
jgi:arylsulfatase A-like enzyme